MLGLVYNCEFAIRRITFDSIRFSETRRSAKNCLRSRGYAVSIERWPIENGKGIDDLLIGGHQPELLAGSQATEFVAGLLEDQCAPIETVVSVQAVTEVLGAPATNGTENTVPVPESSSVLPFPVDVFPAPVRRFALQVAESLGCPIDLVAVPMLAVSATAIGASRALEVKPGWLEAARFYIAFVAPPGSGKTPAESAACGPAYEMQARFRQEYRQAREEYEEAEELRRQRGRRRAPDGSGTTSPVQASPNGLDTDTMTEAPALAVTQDENSNATASARQPKPVLQRVTVSDATTESLAPILAENPRGIVMIKDELSGWVAAMNQYKGGKGADRQFFLSCWSGEPAIVDRKTQGEPIFVSHPFLNVMGGIQPDMLSTLTQDNNRADGFLDRLLFTYPEPLGALQWVDQGVDPEVQCAWADTLNLLFQLQMRHCDDRAIEMPQIVHFTSQARARWVAWHDSNAEEIASTTLPEVFKGPWRKMRSYCARLALVVHMLRLVCHETTDENVDAESVTRAIQLIDYFKSHAKKVYGQLNHDQDDRRVDQLVTWIQNHGGECCSRDLVRSNAANIKKTTDANKMLKDLVDRGLGHFDDRPGGNNRKVTYFVLN